MRAPMTRPASTSRWHRFELAELDRDLDLSEPRLERWLWSLVALGIGLRVLAYMLRLPLFSDEAKLAVSLLDRGYAGLLDPLAHNQIAPFLFMWIQKTATVVFGFSEYSLRLIPVLAASAAVLLMRHVIRRLFVGTAALFSMALFAVSYYPIRHGAELKPYATDLLASLVLTALAVEWLRQPARPRWLWLFAAIAPVAMAVSYTAVLVAAGILAALAIPVWRRRDWPNALAWTAGVLFAGVAFALNYYLVAAGQYQLRAAAKLPMAGGFPPPGDLLGTLRWFVQAHTGRTFGYPLGVENGGSLLTFVAFVAGVVVLFRAGRRRLPAVLLCPFGLGLIAAMVQRYPYGGSARVSQYLVPAICLLAGLGAARLSSLARHSATRRRAQKGVLVFLVLFGVLFGTSLFLRPYRDRTDMVGRDFARWFWDVKSRDAELVRAWEDLRLEFARPPAQWAPGGAGYRINQQIYSPRIGRGEAPDYTKVSRRHPLRVIFLGSALSKRRRALEEWFQTMHTRYDLVGREWHRFGGFRQQHGREDWLELYTFVPRGKVAPLRADAAFAHLRNDLDPPGLEACGPRGDWAPSMEPPVGTVDQADCRSITGTARDPDTAASTLIEVYKPGSSEPIGAVCADLLREDVPSDEKEHGFILPTPDELKTGQAKAFEILAYDLGLNGNLLTPRQPLYRSRQTVTCDPVAAAGTMPSGSLD